MDTREIDLSRITLLPWTTFVLLGAGRVTEMESQYDSDMSEDTRELVEQGLAISRKKHSSRADRSREDLGPAPICNMDTANVPYPLAQIVPAGKTSTQGRIPACG